jgi:DNA-binding beta-propeller fold protein YncE
MKTNYLIAAIALAGCSGDPEPEPTQLERVLTAGDACNQSGNACTYLGLSGEEGFNGDGKHRLETKLYWSFDMLFASDGSKWFIDWNNHTVRRVLPDDTVETIVGWIDPIFPGDGAQDERTADGALGIEVQLNHPTDMAEMPDGKILLMAWHNHKLRVIDPVTKRVKIIAGAGAGYAGDGGPLSMLRFRQPKALEVDDQGNRYILDQQNFRIRMIAADDTISTIAGSAMPGFEGDGGPALMAKFGFEAGSNPEPSGGVAVADGKLYVADTLNNRIRVIDLATGIIDTMAGTGEAGFAGDGGPAMQAELNGPRDIEIFEGSLYVADTDNSAIRKIDLASGTITTVAGRLGELGLELTEGKPATETVLKRPFAVEFDPEGNMYVSDTINSRILRVAK